MLHWGTDADEFAVCREIVTSTPILAGVGGAGISAFKALEIHMAHTLAILWHRYDITLVCTEKALLKYNAQTVFRSRAIEFILSWT